MSQPNLISNVDAPSKPGIQQPLMQPMWGADGNPISALTPEQSLMPYSDVSDKTLPQFQNGRVIGLDDEKAGNQFQLFTENNNNCDTAKGSILYGTLTRSTLSDAFFSKANMKCLQNQLRYRVWKASGGEFKIGPQNNTSLQVIMRAMYLLYSKHLPYNITDQIKELNRQTIEYTLPKIMSEIKQYLFYRQDIQQYPQPIPLPKNVSSTGTRTLASVTTTF